MTKKLAEHFQNSHHLDTRKVLNFVAAQLIGQMGVQGSNPFTDLDVEKVMTAIELLGERRNLELAPFVYAWHPAVENMEVPTYRPPRLPREILHAIAKGIGTREQRDGDLERPLAEFIRGVVGVSSGDGVIFRKAFQSLQAALVEVLAKPDDTSYLRPLFSLCPPTSWLVIATLNYDLTVETEARAASVKVDTGVAAWAESGDWQWPTDGVRLLKLHGSIDWRGYESRNDTLPQYRISVVGSDQRLRSPAIVFGGRSKIRASGPFLELLAQFESLLREASTLLIVGYSFRDDHVNEVVRRWVNHTDKNRVVVVEPSWLPLTRREGDTFPRDLSIALTGHGPLPAVAPAVGFPGRPEMPAMPQRLKVVPQGARSGLPTAVAAAAAVDDEWDVPTY